MDILQRIDQYRWLLPRKGEMLCDALVLADQQLLEVMVRDGSLEQLRGVASLPGIVGPALAMPDAHQGYGFPIGGVAAFDPSEGVISPGGVGYDINCGVRLMRSKLQAAELGPQRLERLADALALGVPAGVGQGGALRLEPGQLRQVMELGAAWAVGQGQGLATDLEFCEAEGALPGAEPGAVSQRAYARGRDQAGSLGAGNHFLELAQVEEIFDDLAAQAFGLELGQLVAWIHTGSRGLGHQVCEDHLRALANNPEALHPRDRQLVSARPSTASGARYLGAMAAAANFAFNNRQLLTHLTRAIMEKTLGLGPAALGLGLVYDVAHNVAKLETHQVRGGARQLLVHRKGATRALGPGHPELPERYRAVGQPVLLPGDMGRGSYVLVGSARAQSETFASSAHGAGRRMSRSKAKQEARGRKLEQEMLARRVLVRSQSRATLAEEMPEAYKDAAQVASVMHGSGVATLVARTKPLVVIKG